MFHQLKPEQRYTIQAGLQNGITKKAIAELIGVHPSTVSREVRRNGGRRGYFVKSAQESCDIRRERLSGNRRIPPDVKRRVIELLVRENWSPAQISGWLARKGVSVSHETIYRWIRADASGVLAGCCRHNMRHRRHTVCGAGPIPDRVSVHDRPAEADGGRFGDWEMDLLMGRGGRDAILVLCERSRSYLMLRRLPQGRRAEGVADAVIEMLWPYRRNVLSITTDNGPEFSQHARITKALSAPVYFTDPYSAWQKGAVENANMLIRQYIPKKADFEGITDKFVTEVQQKLNRRPREKLNFSTPKDEFFRLLL